MQNRIRSNPYRTTLVCVDSDQEGLLTGRIYHPYLPSGAKFQNLMQFLLTMEPAGQAAVSPVVQSPQILPGPAGAPASLSAGKRIPYRKSRHLLRARDFPAECQLAGICNLAGKEEGRKLSQCVGVGSADAQCCQQWGHTGRIPIQRLSIARGGPFHRACAAALRKE